MIAFQTGFELQGAADPLVGSRTGECRRAAQDHVFCGNGSRQHAGLQWSGRQGQFAARVVGHRAMR